MTPCKNCGHVWVLTEGSVVSSCVECTKWPPLPKTDYTFSHTVKKDNLKKTVASVSLSLDGETQTFYNEEYVQQEIRRHDAELREKIEGMKKDTPCHVAFTDEACVEHGDSCWSESLKKVLDLLSGLEGGRK